MKTPLKETKFNISCSPNPSLSCVNMKTDSRQAWNFILVYWNGRWNTNWKISQIV